MSIATADDVIIATADDVAWAVACLIKVYTPTALTDDERLVLLEYVTGQTDDSGSVKDALREVCRRSDLRGLRGLRGLGVFKVTFGSFVNDMCEQLDNDDPQQLKMSLRLQECGNVVSSYRD